MNARHMTYMLEVHQLARPYRSAESLQNATRLHSYESAAPFDAFRVGDTYSHSSPTKYLGCIQHVHHSLGEGDGQQLVRRTVLYVFDDS